MVISLAFVWLNWDCEEESEFVFLNSRLDVERLCMLHNEVLCGSAVDTISSDV